MAEIHQPVHRLTLEHREKLTVTGVSEVLSFDEESVLLHTGDHTLQVLGSGLKLKQLNPEGGNVCIEGSIDTLSYGHAAPSGSWLGRLFG